MAAEVAVKETAGVLWASLHYSFQYHHTVYHAISNIPVSNLGYISTMGCEESTTAGDSWHEYRTKSKWDTEMKGDNVRSMAS